MAGEEEIGTAFFSPRAFLSQRESFRTKLINIALVHWRDENPTTVEDLHESHLRQGGKIWCSLGLDMI